MAEQKVYLFTSREWLTVCWKVGPLNDETQDTVRENDDESLNVCHLMLDLKVQIQVSHFFSSFCEHFTLDLIYVIPNSFSLINRCGNNIQSDWERGWGLGSTEQNIIDFDVYSFDVAYWIE